jgi:hypothetical protein
LWDHGGSTEQEFKMDFQTDQGGGTKQIVAKVPRVPADWVRKIKFDRTLNDEVESIHILLMEDEQYLGFLDATDDSQAIEGSLSSDNHEAARMIRDKARAINNTKVKTQKLATISRSLNVVMRRYGLSRHDRHRMVGGQVVPGDNQNGG